MPELSAAAVQYNKTAGEEDVHELHGWSSHLRSAAGQSNLGIENVESTNSGSRDVLLVGHVFAFADEVHQEAGVVHCNNAHLCTDGQTDRQTCWPRALCPLIVWCCCLVSAQGPHCNAVRLQTSFSTQ